MRNICLQSQTTHKMDTKSDFRTLKIVFWFTIPIRLKKVEMNWTELSFQKLKWIFHFTMESITITLHDNDPPTQCITVNVMYPIKIIENQIPAGERRLILFQKWLRLARFSFLYHEITDNDDIYVIRLNFFLKSLHGTGNHYLLSTKRSISRMLMFGELHYVDSLLWETSRLSNFPDRSFTYEEARDDFRYFVERWFKCVWHPSVICLLFRMMEANEVLRDGWKNHVRWMIDEAVLSGFSWDENTVGISFREFS
jgi:hypothetical protein